MCAMQHIDIEYTQRLLLNIVDAVCYRSGLMVYGAFKGKWFGTFICTC